MVALILAAGYGTRLYPLTKEVPKAFLPIQGKPILQHLIEKLNPPELGIQRWVFVSNHRYAGQFQEWLSSAQAPVPWAVLDDGSTSEENRLGSIGDLVFGIRAESLDQDLLVLGSDNLFPDDLKGFVRFAKEKGPGVTLGIYELPDRSLASRYGVLTVKKERVLSLEEKPAHPTSALISTAVYFFPRQSVRWVLEYVDSKQSADTLGSFIHWLIPKVPVFAYPFRGPWFDIGDLASYTQAQESYP
ncbi:MAG: nucleotidyltransferase family protein [Candidatus Omnitrophica bacterium]|nr:nucleotidyltransferase family protein [Candidatus Omnitrophota bacterium]